VAVVSAMSGVTNLLIAAARQAAAGDERAAVDLEMALHQRHAPVIAALTDNQVRRARLTAEAEQIIDEAVNLCRGAALLGELTPRALDAILSMGERLSARL